MKGVSRTLFSSKDWVLPPLFMKTKENTDMPFKNDDIATYGSDLLTQYQNVVEQSAEMMAFLEQIHYKKAEIEQEKNIANIRKNITYGIINIEEGCRAAFIIILLIMECIIV